MTAIDVSETTFQTEVLDRSHEVPVVVDFWAAWCGPCRALGPILDKLATEGSGEWVLAKVDVDANPRLANAARVQGIPAVRAFKNGKQVAEFTGALPEPQVRQWLAQLGPSEAERAIERARRAELDGDLDGALDGFRRALSLEPGNQEAKAAVAKLELMQRAGDMDEAELRRRLVADPGDLDAGIALADAAAARGDFDAAFDLLLGAVAALTGDDRERARAHLVSLLDALPADDHRALAARRKLSLVLF